MRKLLFVSVLFMLSPSVVPAETLTFLGGGMWDVASANWKNEAGETVSWSQGAVAAFPSAVSIEVSDGITIGGLTVGSEPDGNATMTFTGSPLTFAADSVITTSVGRIVFNNDVKGAGNLTVERAANAVVASELEDGKGISFGAENAVTVFRNLRLSDVKSVSGKLATDNGNFEDYLRPGNGATRGVYSFQNDGARLTALFQGSDRRPDNNTTFYCESAELVLEQAGADIVGYVASVYRLDVGLFGVDVLDAAHSTTVPAYYTGKADEVKGNNKISLRSVDAALATAEVVFAANVDLTADADTLRAGTGTTVRFAGTLGAANLWSRKLQLAEGAFIDLDVPGRVTFSNQVFFDESSQGAKVGVQGMLRVLAGREAVFTYGGNDNRFGWVGIAGAAYLRNRGKGLPQKIYIADGGCLVSEVTSDGFDVNTWDGLPPKIGKGGTFRAAAVHSLAKQYDVVGGTLEIAYAPLSDSEMQVFHNLSLFDGARVTGERMDWRPVRDNYECAVGCYGSAPSRIECAALWLDHGIVSKAHYDFNVADVTGDEASDLVIAANVDCRSDPGTTRWPLYKWGSGTLEFSGEETRLESACLAFGRTWDWGRPFTGTVRFSGKTATFKGLNLHGDAALDIAPGTRVYFGSATNVISATQVPTPWYENAKLTLKTRLGNKSLRIGTDASGLTSAQLAAIRYADGVTDKTPVFTLDANGYLRDGLSGGFSLRLR